MTPAATWRALSWVVLGAGLATLLWRFVGLADAPFVQDEPKFLTAAWAQWQDGPLYASPLVGSTAHHYGPSVLWLYALTQKLVGRSALAAIATMCSVVTFSQLAGCVGLTLGALGLARPAEVVDTPEARGTLGALLFFTGSSPHQHFWSRLAWDQLTLALPFLVVGLLAAPGKGPGRRVLVGALLGFALSSHPMSAPFVALAAVVAVVAEARPLKAWVLNGLLVGVPLVVINLPWWSVYRLEPDGPPPVPNPLTFVDWLEVFRAPSAARLGYFFDGEWQQASARLLRVGEVGEGLLIALAVVTVLGLLAGLLRKELRLLSLVGLTVILLYPEFYARRGLALHPHYQFPTGWVLILALAALLTAARARPAVPLRLLAGASAAFVALVGGYQVSVVLAWRQLVAERGGTRGIHQSSTLGEQLKVTQQLCSLPPGLWVVPIEAAVFPVALEYHLALEPRCADKRFALCGMYRGCPAADGAGVARVVYGPADDARLFVLGPGQR